MGNRKKSREFLMKLLYMDSINNVDLTDETEIKEFYEVEEEFDMDRAYIKQMVALIQEKKPELDRLIEKYLSGWSLDRLSRMNLAILRLATAEIIFAEGIPDKVAVNEAVNLAKQFSEEDTAGFVNSVLDKILKEKQNPDTMGKIFNTDEPVSPVETGETEIIEETEETDGTVDTVESFETDENKQNKEILN